MATSPNLALLDALTPAQEAQIAVVAETWNNVAFSTAPSDRSRAEAGVRRIYDVAGLSPPEIVWVASPLAIAEQWLVAMKRSEEDSSDASKRAATVSVRGNVRRRVPSSVNDLERRHVAKAVGERVRSSISDPLEEKVHEVRDAIWARVVEELSGRGDARHVARIRYEVGDCYRDRGSGQHDAAWLGCADYYGSVCGLPGFLEATAGLADIARSAGWFSPQFSVCWIAARPAEIHFEDGNALRGDGAFTLVYPDGFFVSSGSSVG